MTRISLARNACFVSSRASAKRPLASGPAASVSRSSEPPLLLSPACWSPGRASQSAHSMLPGGGWARGEGEGAELSPVHSGGLNQPTACRLSCLSGDIGLGAGKAFLISCCLTSSGKERIWDTNYALLPQPLLSETRKKCKRPACW